MRCRAHHPTVSGVYETVSTLSNVFRSFFHSPQKCPDNPKNRPSAPAAATPEAEPRPSSRHSARLTDAVARPPKRVRRPWGSPDSTRSPNLRCVPADPDLCRRDCRRDDLDEAHHFHRPRLLRGLDLALRDQPGDAHAGTAPSLHARNPACLTSPTFAAGEQASAISNRSPAVPRSASTGSQNLAATRHSCPSGRLLRPSLLPGRRDQC